MLVVEKKESPRYPIPRFFNPNPYYVYEAVRRLTEYSSKNVGGRLKNFKEYFPKILYYGLNAENEYNDYKENLNLVNYSGYALKYDTDINKVANSYFIKLALNMMRDYVESMPNVEKVVKNREVSGEASGEAIGEVSREVSREVSGEASGGVSGETSGEESDKVSFFSYEKGQMEDLIEIIETYLDYIINPNKISEGESEGETLGETVGETVGESEETKG